jgi:hypothetical protein
MNVTSAAADDVNSVSNDVNIRASISLQNRFHDALESSSNLEKELVALLKSTI